MADKVRLKPEFLRFMEIRDALPTALEVRNWLARHDVAPKSGVMDQLLKGEAVGLSYVVRFVRYIVERHRAGGAGVYYKALCDYLLPIGKDPKSLSHHQIAECLLMTPEANFRYRGTENFIRAVVDHAISFLPPLIFECQPSQVNEAVRWIYVTAGKERARRGATTDSLRAIEIAERHIRLTLSEYQRRAAAWVQFDPWTIAFAPMEGIAGGVSIILPLRRAAYLEVRGGRLEPHDLQPPDLHRPSRHLFIEALGMRPAEEGGVDDPSQKALMTALFLQVAALIPRRGRHSRRPLRVLSYGTSDAVIEELKADGYKRLDALTPQSSFPLFERTVAWTSDWHKDFILRSLLHRLGRNAERRFRPRRRRPDADV